MTRLKLLVFAIVVFAPASAIVAFAQQLPFEVRPDVVYGHKDGMALTYDVFTPNTGGKGIGLLFMVSGGYVSQWVQPEQLGNTFIKPFLDSGYTVIAVRHGSSPRYLVPEIVGDVKLALQHIYEHAGDYGVDKSRLGVFGFSAGGHLSLVLGTQSNGLGEPETHPRIKAVAAVFPPTDLAPYMTPGNPRMEQFPSLKFDPKKAPDVSPLFHVTSDDAPTVLIHGDKDELVPISHSQNIVEEFKKAKVPYELVVMPGFGHGFDEAGNKKMFAEMLEWFGEHL